MLAVKISAFCFRILTGKLLICVALRVFSFFTSLNESSALSHKSLNFHPLVTLLIAMMLRCLLCLKIDFHIGCDQGLTSSHSGIFVILIVLKETLFTFFAVLASFVKILSFSTGVTYSEDFVLSEKKP